MDYMPWKNEYTVNNDEMDKQHQVLVGMINQLHEAMRSGKGKTETSLIVKQMIEYSAFHFKAEETLMKNINFSKFNEHKKEHQAFMDKTYDFQKQLDSGAITISLDIASFLKNWLTDHILVNDKAYSTLLK